jgi:phage terminase large subunit
MTKEEVEKLYKELGDSKIKQLYNYNCLIYSGFDKEKAYDFIDLLNDLWLSDENNYSISTISDMLYETYNVLGEEMDEMTSDEILEEMYAGEIDESEW